jgi:hypothetical protein
LRTSSDEMRAHWFFPYFITCARAARQRVARTAEQKPR